MASTWSGGNNRWTGSSWSSSGGSRWRNEDDRDQARDEVPAFNVFGVNSQAAYYNRPQATGGGSWDNRSTQSSRDESIAFAGGVWGTDDNVSITESDISSIPIMADAPMRSAKSEEKIFRPKVHPPPRWLDYRHSPGNKLKPYAMINSTIDKGYCLLIQGTGQYIDVTRMTTGDLLEACGQPSDREKDPKAITYANIASKAGGKMLGSTNHPHAPNGPNDEEYKRKIPTLEKEGLMAFCSFCQTRVLSGAIDDSLRNGKIPTRSVTNPRMDGPPTADFPDGNKNESIYDVGAGSILDLLDLSNITLCHPRSDIHDRDYDGSQVELGMAKNDNCYGGHYFVIPVRNFDEEGLDGLTTIDDGFIVPDPIVKEIGGHPIGRMAPGDDNAAPLFRAVEAALPGKTIYYHGSSLNCLHSMFFHNIILQSNSKSRGEGFLKGHMQQKVCMRLWVMHHGEFTI